MKDLIRITLLLTTFTTAVMVLHLAASLAHLTGLPALLAYCLPVIGLITYTTTDHPHDMPRTFAVIAFWFYAVLLTCAGIAVLA